jgi:hypothetical protein
MQTLAEGTYTFPDTPEKVRELKKILAKPLRGVDAQAALKGIFGDDGLADTIAVFKKSGDVRDIVKGHINKFLKPGAINQRVSPELRAELQALCTESTSRQFLTALVLEDTDKCRVLGREIILQKVRAHLGINLD